MKNIVVIPNLTKELGMSVTERLVEKLLSLGFTVYADEKIGLSGAVPYTAFPDGIDLIVALGGDGSVIDASKIAVEKDVPIIGVNLGKVGYLSEVDPSELNIFELLVRGEYSVEEKMLLEVVDNEGISSCALAVNDVVVSHGEALEISEFKLQDSLGNSLRYRADGIIFATPQGTTAYSLSSGGPIVAHDVESIVATPLSPHSFFNRSVLFNSSEVLTVTNSGVARMNIGIDGRVYKTLLPGEHCKIKRSASALKMVSFSRNNMFTELFKKMSILEGLK